MVMEYAQNDLQNLIMIRHIPFNTSQVKSLMKQLLQGLAYLHSRWYLHRDLKTSNLLYTNDGHVKICDFGMSRQYTEPLEAYTNLVVTPWYRAPELLLGCENYGPAIDLWSVGCIFTEIFRGKVLFHGRGELNQLELIFDLMGNPTENTWPDVKKFPHWSKVIKIKKINKLKTHFPLGFDGQFNVTSSCVDLIRKLINLNPKQRITAIEALNHPWFKEIPTATPLNQMPNIEKYISKYRNKNKN